jgi:RNA polymerase sigma-70 factor, ECF subfamily
MNATMESLRLRACGPNPLVSWTDEKLMLSYCSDGNAQAFEELVHRYEKELYGYLRHYLGNAEMAEDVFQQTFLQIHLKCEQFEPGRKVRPWLYTVATNQAIDYQRRNRRHRMRSLNHAAARNGDGASASMDIFDRGVMGPDIDVETAEEHEALHRAVEALPELSKQIVTLVFFQGLKYREAAEILSVPVGTVKSRLHAAMRKLTEILPSVSLPN